MKISKVKVRFSRYITETDKAYCLEYSGQKLWIPKKISIIEKTDYCRL